MSAAAAMSAEWAVDGAWLGTLTGYLILDDTHKIPYLDTLETQGTQNEHDCRQRAPYPHIIVGDQRIWKVSGAAGATNPTNSGN